MRPYTDPSDGGLAPIGFSLNLPDSWFELDVRRSTRDASIRLLVESRVREQPELWEHRSDIIRLLRRQARDAADAGAIYCACFVMVVGDGIIPGSMTVTLLPPPPAGSSPDSVAELMPSKEAAHEGDTWSTRSVIDVSGIGRVVRTHGVADVQLSGGAVRSILAQTFVSLDNRRMLMVSAASPAIDLAEPLLELFDAVADTLRLVSR
jgi:hypothetical protein